jgi:ankyrin repeat protein
MMDLVAAAALRDWEMASKISSANRQVIDKGGALHLLSKRGDPVAMEWLLKHGANPDALWSHWDSEVTALHLAVMQGHIEIVRLLLDAGANPRIRDSKHDGDARGWAEFFKRPEIVALLSASSNP